jgi:hypothetical protein
MVLMLWYWGVDMWVWTKHRVNYVFIFEFNPRRHVRYQHIFEAAAIFTFFLVSSLLLYMLTAAQDGVFGWEIPGFTWLESVPPHRSFRRFIFAHVHFSDTTALASPQSSL